MHLEDSETSGRRRALDDDPAIEPTRAQERWVEHVGAVRRRENDREIAAGEAVHLRQKLVQGLLALVVAATEARSSHTTDGVDLVDEDDRRSGLLRLVEQLAHA